LPVAPENFELLRGKNSLTSYTFGTGMAQHTVCSHCGMHAFYVPRSQPDRITVNARCLDDIDGPSLKPTRFFDGRHWEEAQRRRIAEGGHVAAAGLNGAVTLKRILGVQPIPCRVRVRAMIVTELAHAGPYALVAAGYR
jgi:hypothetical protein